MTAGHVNTFWNGAQLNPVELACLQSFADRGIQIRFFSYKPLTLPPGMVWMDAAAILPQDQLFHFHGSPSAFSNIFRYKLLYEQGGWWVDTDVVLHGVEMPDLSHYYAWQDRTLINGAVLKFPAGDWLCGKLLEASLARAAEIKEWGDIGPHLLTELILGGPYEHLTAPAGSTYPLHWLQTHYLWFPEYASLVQTKLMGATFVHLWNSLFPRLGLDLEQPLPEGSYLAQLTGSLFPSHVAPLNPALRAKAVASVRSYLTEDWVQGTWDAALPPGESLLLPA